MPRLTVGLPVYNGEKYLAEAIDALLGQTYEDFELIISDNASTDATASICRTYEDTDPRVRYVRQQRNIGAAPNHHFLVDQARGEFFKWAAADDLYARTLLERCIDALDEYPEVVLAHSWTGAIDSTGKVTQALEYPLATDSRSAPERFRSMLFGGGGDDYGLIAADDQYGVMRLDVLRRVPAQGSYYHSDRTMMTEIALHGPFHQARDWLYFRRDHAERPQHACPTMRAWCANLEPSRANRLRHPTVRLLSEYLWGYVAAIQRAPISAADRRDCYRHLMRWIVPRALPVARRAVRGGTLKAGEPVYVAPPDISIEKIVARRESTSS